MDPTNLETLWRLRQNYDRLNDERKLRDIDIAIEKLIAPKNSDFRQRKINKGESFLRKFFFPGGRVAVELTMGGERKNPSPLVSIFWNGHVVWEDYLRASSLALDVETGVGENILEILPVNCSITLMRMRWRPAGESGQK